MCGGIDAAILSMMLKIGTYQGKWPIPNRVSSGYVPKYAYPGNPLSLKTTKTQTQGDCCTSATSWLPVCRPVLAVRAPLGLAPFEG